MNLRRRLVAKGFCFSIPMPSFARRTGIGLALRYEAKQQSEIVWLDFDGVRKLGGRLGVMYINQRSPANEALVWPGGIKAMPRTAHAIWRYKEIDPIDEAAQHTLHERDLPWRDAEATVTLYGAMDTEVRALIEKGSHRPRLTLIFDRDQLRVGWRAELKL